MKDWINYFLLAAVVGGYFLVMMIAKNVYSSQVTSAMAKGDNKHVEKLIFSKLAIFLLNHQMLCMMRASFCVTEERYDEAKRYLGMIKLNKLSLQQTMSFYALKMQLALSSKDFNMANEVQNELKDQNEVYENDDIKTMIEDNEIQIALVLDYDSSVIEKLNARVKQCKNQDEKGLLLINLAKAYHLNGQDEEACSSLNHAKEVVTNELTLKLIDAGLKDIHILD